MGNSKIKTQEIAIIAAPIYAALISSTQARYLCGQPELLVDTSNHDLMEAAIEQAKLLLNSINTS